jgi:hypothetical protein
MVLAGLAFGGTTTPFVSAVYLADHMCTAVLRGYTSYVACTPNLTPSDCSQAYH